MWPEMARMVKERIREADAQGKWGGFHRSTKEGVGGMVSHSTPRPRAPGTRCFWQHREYFPCYDTPSSLRRSLLGVFASTSLSKPCAQWGRRWDGLPAGVRL